MLYCEEVKSVWLPRHRRRGKFPLPKWWGRKAWHRKRRGDEKVVAKKPKGVWDKDDLR